MDEIGSALRMLIVFCRFSAPGDLFEKLWACFRQARSWPGAPGVIVRERRVSILSAVFAQLHHLCHYRLSKDAVTAKRHAGRRYPCVASRTYCSWKVGQLFPTSGQLRVESAQILPGPSGVRHVRVRPRTKEDALAPRGTEQGPCERQASAPPPHQPAQAAPARTALRGEVRSSPPPARRRRGAAVRRAGRWRTQGRAADSPGGAPPDRRWRSALARPAAAGGGGGRWRGAARQRRPVGRRGGRATGQIQLTVRGGYRWWEDSVAGGVCGRGGSR